MFSHGIGPQSYVPGVTNDEAKLVTHSLLLILVMMMVMMMMMMMMIIIDNKSKFSYDISGDIMPT